MSLVSLDVGGNDLERIPSELSRCTALERLDLSGGKVETLPEAFSKLTRLRSVPNLRRGGGGGVLSGCLPWLFDHRPCLPIGTQHRRCYSY